MRFTLDRGLVLAVIFLLGLGLVQVYSSSFIFAIESFGDGLHFVKKQSLFVGLGIAVLLVTAYLPFRWLWRIGGAVWLLSAVGVFLTLIPGVGIKAGGARRWLPFAGEFRMEPGELLKISAMFFLVYLLASDRRSWGRYRLPAMILLFIAPVAALLRQPDFGSFVIIMGVSFMLVFAAGAAWRYVLAGGLAIAGVAAALVIAKPYRLARVASFLDPWADPADKGFQVIQSLLGFYSGGVTGTGLGAGQGKLFFLPEAHTDFTLSVLGEELGFIGVAAVLLLLGFVIMRGFQIAIRCHENRTQWLALGITLTLACTVTINAGVAMGLLPTKGLGMPFLSYGGSALIAACFALGALLNIERTTHRIPRSFAGVKIKPER